MLKLIPRSIICRTARETGVDVKARTYSVFSHLGTAYAPMLERAAVLLVFWLILFWMYRRRIFIRI